MIHDGPEPAACVRLEVSDGHFAARQKCGDSGEQAQSDENATAELDDASGQSFRIIQFALAAENAEEFLRSVTGEEGAGDNPREGINVRFVFRKESLHGLNFSPGFSEESR